MEGSVLLGVGRWGLHWTALRRVLDRLPVWFRRLRGLGCIWLFGHIRKRRAGAVGSSFVPAAANLSIFNRVSRMNLAPPQIACLPYDLIPDIESTSGMDVRLACTCIKETS